MSGLRERLIQALQGPAELPEEARAGVPELARSHGGWVGEAGKAAVAGVTLPRDVYEGKVSMTSDEGQERLLDLTGLMTLGATAAPAGALGSGAVRPSAKALGRALTQDPRHVPGKPDTVTIPGHGEVQAAPIRELEDSAASYMRSVGRPGEHSLDAYNEFDADNARRIAEAFERMKHDPQNPEVKRAYDAMIEETLAQYRSLKDTGVDFKFLKDGEPDPYAASPALGYVDLLQNGKLHVFPTDQGFGTLSKVEDNPLLKRVGRVGDLDNATANDAFRVVHDSYGHFAPGNPFFRHKGEERAWENHSRMYSPEARAAMTTETRGQNSWLNFGPWAEHNRNALGSETVFADQKIGLLPKWAQEAIKRNGGSLAGLPVAIQLALSLQADEETF